MNPVEQTIFTVEEGGNCMAACLASLFELPLNEVPNAAKEWAKSKDPEYTRAGWLLIEEWLDSFGLEHVEFNGTEWIPRGYWIASVPSPRLEGETHAVIFEGRTFVWDPHPDHDTYTLDDVRSVYTFILKDPMGLKH